MQDATVGIEPAGPRPVPEVPAGGRLGGWRHARSFQSDWQRFLTRCAERTGSTAFRLVLGARPVVAVIDGVGVRAMRDPERFDRPYGFGPRRPSPRVIGSTVPTVFTDGALHARRKQLHLDRVREAWPNLDPVMDEVLGEVLPGWEQGRVPVVGPEIERIVGRVLFRWLLDAEPPMADLRVVGNGVIPLRPTDRLPMPGDRAVRAAFTRLVGFVRRAPRFEAIAASAARHGVSAADLARDLAFVLAMNAWAALSGAAVSAVAELTRHPEHRDRIARDPAHVAAVVREVLRLHPPAPAVFGIARADGPLPTRTGPVSLRAGDLVMGVLAMAHRDPAVFADPDAFDPDRYREPGLADEVLWTGGPEGLAPGPGDRICPGRDAVRAILHRLVAAIAEGRWALARRPEWGTALRPRNVPAEPLVLVAWRRGPPGVAWTTRPRRVSGADRLRMAVVAGVRAIQRRSVEEWSATTYRTPPRPGPAPAVGRAAEVLDAPDLPPELVVPRRLPAHGAMGPRYVAPYYYAAGALFGVLERAGLDPRATFRADHPALRAFPDGPEGWGNLQNDDTFGRLRLQGPNPYLLTAVGPGAWIADYGPAFAGIAPPVVCRFEADRDGLQPVAIDVDGRRTAPGSEGWRRAKLLANALDARLTVYGEHLGRTHLVIAQAFALARFDLPRDHPLRPFLDLHAFATLQVNDFAYKLLLSPSSYFVRSGFVSRDQAARLFRNLCPTTDARRLLPERDVAERGLDGIPGHPYAEEALAAFAVLKAYARRVVDAAYAGDAAVLADTDLAAWDGTLRRLLPRPAAAALPAPLNRSGLAELLAAWVFNNVAHEVCGDFSPYVSGCDEEQARLVDFDRLRMGIENGPVSLAGVFLMKQGAYAGLFDTRGNGMLRVDPAAVTACPAHELALRDLQTELRALSEAVQARNAARAMPFLRMDPARWELSIGF